MKNGEDRNFFTRCNAYHEAGHAVAAIIYGYEVIAVDIRSIEVPGLGQTNGSAEIALPKPQTLLGKGEQAVMPLLVVLLAGVFAEQRVNAEAGLDLGHEQSDGQQALKYAAGAICKPVSCNGILVTPSEELTNQEQAILACFEKGWESAKEFTNAHGAAIDAVGEALAKFGVLSPSEVEQLVAEAMAK